MDTIQDLRKKRDRVYHNWYDAKKKNLPEAELLKLWKLYEAAKAEVDEMVEASKKAPEIKPVAKPVQKPKKELPSIVKKLKNGRYKIKAPTNDMELKDYVWLKCAPLRTGLPWENCDHIKFVNQSIKFNDSSSRVEFKFTIQFETAVHKVWRECQLEYSKSPEGKWSYKRIDDDVIFLLKQLKKQRIFNGTKFNEKQFTKLGLESKGWVWQY